MKKGFFICTTIFLLVGVVIFSCKRTPVPQPNCSTITLSSAAATTSQTVAINSPVTSITYTLGGGATGASVIGMPAGVSGAFSGNVLTISGTPTASGPFTYTVTTTGSTCTATATGTINVTSSACSETMTLTSANATTSQTVAINNPITPITYTIGGGATGFRLFGGPVGIIGTLNGNVATISGSPTVSGSFTYTIETTGGPCVTSQTGTFTVTP